MSNSIATGVAYADPEFTDVTITGTLTVGGSVFNAAELGALDGVTAGTVTANKAVIVDGSKNIGTFGTITAANLTANTAVQGATVTATTGIRAGSSGTPIAQATAANVNQFYVTASAASGDTRAIYARTNFTGAGAGETLRAFSTVAAAQGAGQTTNGAHISLSVNTGGSISGAGNALRATLGVAAGVTPGGTLAAIQVDSDFPSSVTLPGSAAFLRFTNSNTGTITNLMNVPAAMVATDVGSAVSHTIRIVDSAGTPYYLMVSDQP